MAKIAIIGGGIAGLAAGIYAQKTGFESIVYERHTIPGGLVCWWKRKGFLIDNCVHWLTGTRENTDIYKVWEDVGVLGNNIEVLRPASFMQVERNGQSLNLWRDLNRVRTDMLSLSPEDAPAIEEFIALCRTYNNVVLVADKPLEQQGLLGYAKLIWRMRKVGKVHRIYQYMSIPDYAQRFKHPLIRKFLTVYFPKFYNVSSLFYTFAAFCHDNADLPRGGSKGMVDHMQARYESLGGKLLTGYEANKVNIQQGHAYSVEFSNGETIEADYIVAACDLHYTMQHLLPEECIDRYMTEHFITAPQKYPTYSSIDLYFAVDHITETLPCAIVLDIQNLQINGTKISNAFMKHFNYEPDFAPEGKSILQVLITQYGEDYDYWNNLRQNDMQAYKAEKALIAQHIEECLADRFPELKGTMQLLDICTPATTYRFCKSYQGALMSFALTPDNEKQTHNGRVQGVSNMYLAGQWLQAPGGTPNAVVTGKFAIQRIIKDHKLKNNF
ncbi:MAG: FAD-dependent oxidoreductase [Paludibacter sp.]|nr:FAD-dependent oxidoreductase [Bacteroidales bacterium]MCM1069316.1 FAD-dependent oxidoreductase [Prevotella sp.]MCM1353701.1 FAD-dependent oxidoreductase [Bacteroides sp.]MCM1442231.1 FAD-dependent oxidoreductase [Muribaculum sp.]MCM1482193.1 FAD-dependent oxidoreductase [Paludibacter sp.]